MGKLFIFSAPSGAGKTTLINALRSQNDNLCFAISATSRKKRSYEIEGVHYYFISPEMFRKKIDANAFIEWEEVYPNLFYGTLRSEIDRIWNSGKDVLLDIDVVGALNIKSSFGDSAITIFVQPPSIETLKSRLSQRNSDDEESIKTRLQKAEYELSFANKFDKIIVNDVLENAIKEADTFIKLQ